MISRVALVCAPWRDRTEDEAQDTLEAKLWLLKRGWCPVFLPESLQSVLDDAVADERATALQCSLALCRALATAPGAVMVVVCERVTEGMSLDQEAWVRAGGGPPVPFKLLVNTEDCSTETGPID